MAEFVEPQVYLIAYTMVDENALIKYLESIDTEWWTDASTHGELLIEAAGRLCYASWDDTGKNNKNVTRVRTGNKSYLENILKSGHGSVTEHVTCTFLFQNVTRVFTSELNRHRAGCAISEASLRYIRLDELKAYMPDIFKDLNTDIENYILDKFEDMENIQQELAQYFDLDNKSFNEKKKITSAMRRLAPMGLCTNIIWTANIRALRHILELRTSVHAEEEIRFVFDHVGFILQEKYPHLFGDFTRDEHGQWATPYSKV